MDFPHRSVAMSTKQREFLFQSACDFAFDVFLSLTSIKTGRVISIKLKETMTSFLKILTQLRRSDDDSATLVPAASDLLERVSVFIDIASDFLKLEMWKYEMLKHHLWSLKFSLRSLNKNHSYKTQRDIAS
jgi:hypothetical protein